jgi:hypothetical protein
VSTNALRWVTTAEPCKAVAEFNLLMAKQKVSAGVSGVKLGRTEAEGVGEAERPLYGVARDFSSAASSTWLTAPLCR